MKLMNPLQHKMRDSFKNDCFLGVLLQDKYFEPLLTSKTPTVEAQQEFLAIKTVGCTKFQIPVYFVVTFGTNSIRNVIFIAFASRFRRFRLGFRSPFSSLLMSA